jgi:hypothetical protein
VQRIDALSSMWRFWLRRREAGVELLATCGVEAQDRCRRVSAWPTPRAARCNRDGDACFVQSC